MDRPRSAARRRTSAGDHGLAIRSFSNTSTPSKPARDAAASFSCSVPLSETVAMERRSREGPEGWTDVLPGAGPVGCSGIAHDLADRAGAPAGRAVGVAEPASAGAARASILAGLPITRLHGLEGAAGDAILRQDGARGRERLIGGRQPGVQGGVQQD